MCAFLTITIFDGNIFRKRIRFRLKTSATCQILNRKIFFSADSELIFSKRVGFRHIVFFPFVRFWIKNSTTRRVLKQVSTTCQIFKRKNWFMKKRSFLRPPLFCIVFPKIPTPLTAYNIIIQEKLAIAVQTENFELSFLRILNVVITMFSHFVSVWTLYM